MQQCGGKNIGCGLFNRWMHLLEFSGVTYTSAIKWIKQCLLSKQSHKIDIYFVTAG